MDFMEDANVHDINDQFMFGESFMVAPVLENADSRVVYLPENKNGGGWFNFHTGER